MSNNNEPFRLYNDADGTYTEIPRRRVEGSARTTPPSKTNITSKKPLPQTDKTKRVIKGHKAKSQLAKAYRLVAFLHNKLKINLEKIAQLAKKYGLTIIAAVAISLIVLGGVGIANSSKYPEVNDDIPAYVQMFDDVNLADKNFENLLLKYQGANNTEKNKILSQIGEEHDNFENNALILMKKFFAQQYGAEHYYDITIPVHYEKSDGRYYPRIVINNDVVCTSDELNENYPECVNVIMKIVALQRSQSTEDYGRDILELMGSLQNFGQEHPKFMGLMNKQLGTEPDR